jgi:DHA1 family multidrug resistance protein-like MFS transporter
LIDELSGERSLIPLSWCGLSAVLLGTFSIAIGFGIVLPVVPFAVERLAFGSDAAWQSRHVGLLTGTYVMAIFLFAPLWGKLSDRHGRRPILLFGLIGFAVSSASFSFVLSLPLLYLIRTLEGLFAAAVVPTAYALVVDRTDSRQSRARLMVLINIAATAGFLVGPLLSGAVLLATRPLAEVNNIMFSAPFFVTAALALAAALMVFACVPATTEQRRDKGARHEGRQNRTAMFRLWAVAFATAFAVGSFEVGLSLHGKHELNLNPYQIGILFAECSLVMFIAQACVFSPFIDPIVTRKFLSRALIALAIGLTFIPFVESYFMTVLAVGLIAGSAGVVSPIVTYWVSVGGGAMQGRALGRATAAASLGQAAGSATGGLLFDVSIAPNTPLLIAAGLVIATIIARPSLSTVLTPPRFALLR